MLSFWGPFKGRMSQKMIGRALLCRHFSIALVYYKMEKPPCIFGAKCYRKNSKHFESFSHPEQLKKEPKLKRPNNNKESCGKEDLSSSLKRKGRTFISEQKMSRIQNKKVKTTTCSKSYNNNNVSVESEKSSSNGESVQSMSCSFINSESNETKSTSFAAALKNKTVKEIIKTLFLVDMPSDFYSFYEFCKSLNDNGKMKTFQLGDLKLVGPFDILSGEVNYISDQDLYLCHWRFYYDPPEFQTVLANESGFHIGYWRDDPKENPVFLASNNPNKDCIFKMEGENIFGTVFHYLSEFIVTCDPFQKVQSKKIQNTLCHWAKTNKFPLEKKTSKMNERQKKIASKTFHKIGILVPIDPKTELGYRPLIETDANLRRICNSIMKAKDESERESLWENLQSLVCAANIANDECDFGNSLELGIDLFCMGSPVFHETIEHLLCTAYSLLNRTEFETIIKTHLKFRRKSNYPSIYN